jgi:tRNA (adenine57-N1/adenine58-N1)-methyltransferase
MAALRSGGIFLCYVPTVPQALQASEALRASGGFGLVETMETLVRGWNLDGPSVRPAHRMIGHTGFITTARRVQTRRTASDGGRTDAAGSGARETAAPEAPGAPHAGGHHAQSHDEPENLLWEDADPAPVGEQ